MFGYRTWGMTLGTSTRAVPCVCAGERLGCFFWEFNLPSLSGYVQYPQGTTSAEPAFGNLFEVFHTVYDISFCVLIRQIKQMDRAG